MSNGFVLFTWYYLKLYYWKYLDATSKTMIMCAIVKHVGFQTLNMFLETSLTFTYINWTLCLILLLIKWQIGPYCNNIYIYKANVDVAVDEITLLLKIKQVLIFHNLWQWSRLLSKRMIDPLCLLMSMRMDDNAPLENSNSNSNLLLF